MWDMIDALIDTPLTTIKDGLSGLVDNYAEKIRLDNPFKDENSIEFKTFYVSWVVGYVVGAVAVMVGMSVITAGVGTAIAENEKVIEFVGKAALQFPKLAKGVAALKVSLKVAKEGWKASSMIKKVGTAAAIAGCALFCVAGSWAAAHYLGGIFSKFFALGLGSVFALVQVVSWIDFNFGIIEVLARLVPILLHNIAHLISDFFDNVLTWITKYGTDFVSEAISKASRLIHMAWDKLSEFLEFVFLKVKVFGMALIGDTDEGMVKYLERKVTKVKTKDGIEIDLTDYSGCKKVDLDHYTGRHYTCTEDVDSFTTTTKMVDEKGNGLYDRSTRNGLDPAFNDKFKGLTDGDIDRIIADADIDDIKVENYHSNTGACKVRYTLKPEDQTRYGVGEITEEYGADHFAKTRYPSNGVGTELSESNVRAIVKNPNENYYRLSYVDGGGNKILFACSLPIK